MMSENLQRAYLELEINEKNLDVYQACSEIDLLSASIERDKINQQRAKLAEKCAKLELRRLHEEIEQLKAEQAPVAEPVSRSGDAPGVYISAQRFEDLRLVCSSIGKQYLPSLPDFADVVTAWFELLHAVVHDNDSAHLNGDLQSHRQFLKEDLVKNTLRGQARKV